MTRPEHRDYQLAGDGTMITYRDMLDQVRQATDASEGEYDNEAITRTLVERHGLVNIDDIESDAFWSVVMEHARSEMVDKAAQAWFAEWVVEQVAASIAEAVSRGFETFDQAAQWARETNTYPGFAFERPPTGHFEGKRTSWRREMETQTFASDLHLDESDLNRAIEMAKGLLD